MAEKILRYIQGILNLGLFYSQSNNFQFAGYSNNDWGGDLDDRKNIFGFVFFIGNTVFSWMSKKQSIVTLSTCEAEYIAAFSCISHAI